MTIFDMSLETTTIIDVPEYVPIIGQSLVYLDVSVEGILIAIGGQTEINGVLNTVSESIFSGILVAGWESWYNWQTSLAEVYIYDIASGTGSYNKPLMSLESPTSFMAHMMNINQGYKF
jgi:hypothetical protein